MLVTLVAVLCNSQLCLEKVVTTSEQSGITMAACHVNGQIGIADLQLEEATQHLHAWLAEGRHGTMQYMARHASLRAEPQRLLPGALRAITARMDYLPQRAADWADRELARQHEAGTAVVSMYARGRDYHKVLRSRLQTLAERIESAVGEFAWRVATDTAPVFG